MKVLLNNITNTVCQYLRVNEDLFFASKNCERITSARQYVAYLAIYKFDIAPSVVSAYMGVALNRASVSTVRAVSVYSSIRKDNANQIALDIQALENLLIMVETNGIHS